MRVNAPDQPLRVLVQQPALPAYRVPVFAALNARPGLSVKVLYTDPSWNAKNVPAQGFDAVPETIKQFALGGRTVRWHPAAWHAVGQDTLWPGTPGDPRVIIMSWDLHNALLVPTLRRARRKGIATVLWGHGYSKHEASWRENLRNRVARFADTLLLYNHKAADAIIDAGFDSARVFVALNALDRTIRAAREFWTARPAELQAFQQAHHLTGRHVLLYVSRLDPDNRVERMIDAVAQLRQQGRDVVGVIVGAGAPLAALQQQAKALGIQEAIHFPGVIYEQEKLAPWFLSADLFCYPENIGLSLLHAFGYGLPVITSDRLDAQNPEIEALQDGINGRLYAHGDTAALTAVIGTLLDDPATLARLSHHARQTITERFTLANMVDGMEQAVRAADSRRRG